MARQPFSTVMYLGAAPVWEPLDAVARAARTHAHEYVGSSGCLVDDDGAVSGGLYRSHRSLLEALEAVGFELFA